jgi:hypothetical protein
MLFLDQPQDAPPPPLEGAPPAPVAEEWIFLGIPGTFLMWAAVAFAALWLGSTVFIQMRRRATNLTSAHQAGVKKEATPDFLKVDDKARAEALKRGEQYDKELVEREKAEAEAKAGKPSAKKDPVSMVKLLSGGAAFLFSLFTLLGSVLGTFRTLETAGVKMSQFEQLGAIIAKYPIPTAICVFVIGYTIYVWVSQKKWAEPPKI